MARRSPLNARYQKNTGPAGKTRRSASSAKPKREAGGQAPAAPKKKTGDRPSFRQALRGGPVTPEMRRWRRIWWVLIIGAFVLALAAAFLPFIQRQPVLRLVTLVAYLISLGAALFIDLGIIRKLRAKAAGDAKTDKKK